MSEDDKIRYFDVIFTLEELNQMRKRNSPMNLYERLKMLADRNDMKFNKWHYEEFKTDIPSQTRFRVSEYI